MPGTASNIQQRSVTVEKANLHTTGYIRLFSGGWFDPFDPRAEDMLLRDIIHALGNQCRYSGHCLWFYSVLVHSILVSYLVPEEDALEALVHDNSEPYFIDVPTPIKRRIPELNVLEDGIMEEVARRFDIRYPFPPSVKRGDMAAFELEWAALMLREHPYRFERLLLDRGIPPHNRVLAKIKYYERFQELYTKRHGRLYEEDGLDAYIRGLRFEAKHPWLSRLPFVARAADFITGKIKNS